MHGLCKKAERKSGTRGRAPDGPIFSFCCFKKRMKMQDKSIAIAKHVLEKTATFQKTLCVISFICI